MCEIFCVRMFCLAKYATKAWRLTMNTLSKRAKKSSAGASDTEYCSAVVVSRASVNELQTLTARVLCSHLQAYLLPTLGNQATMANRLYQHFHTSGQPIRTTAIRHPWN